MSILSNSSGSSSGSNSGIKSGSGGSDNSGRRMVAAVRMNSNLHWSNKINPTTNSEKNIKAFSALR